MNFLKKNKFKMLKMETVLKNKPCANGWNGLDVPISSTF